MEIDPETSQRFKELDAERAEASKKYRKERNDAVIEERRGRFEHVELSPKISRFCHLVCLGTPQGEAYRAAGFKATPASSVQLASRLLRKPEIARYVENLRESTFLENVLSLAEKRSYLADVARTPIGKVDLNNKLATSARWHNGELVEVRMPDKIKAIELDAKLAGELHDNGLAINVGLQLVNQRLERMELPKDSLPP